jgi:hypothetical protein
MKLTSTLKISPYGCKVVLIITDSLINEANKVYKKHKMGQMFEGDPTRSTTTWWICSRTTARPARRSEPTPPAAN